MTDATWIDLLDPSEADLVEQVPLELDGPVLELLAAPAGEPRPRIQPLETYGLLILIVPILVAEQNRIYYQELDVVIWREGVVTVRKTPRDGSACEQDVVRQAVRPGESPGMTTSRIVDAVAERYLDLVDGIDDEIEELEDHVDAWPAERVRRRISDVRHDILHVRRALAPLRDAAREVLDRRVELPRLHLFDDAAVLAFGNAYDKFLRASEELDFSRDLIASARDYLQAKVSNEQNEVTKRLTVVASLLLVPTFIVGLYGQNFHDIPELDWSFGYWWAWGWILLSTVGQLAYFRWKRWI